MIRIVSSAVKVSLFAGAVLVLAGTANVYSDSCPKAAATDEGKGADSQAVVKEGKAACTKADGEKVKAGCPKDKAVCAKVDGEKFKADCPKDKAACAKADGEKVKADCPKDKATCAKADGEKVKADCPAEKKCCGTCKPAAEVKAQATCPVMGGAINKQLYVDHAGKRVYVCCQGCIAPVQKEPAKYIKALEADGVTLETVKTKDS